MIRVLVVDDHARVRRALKELIDALKGMRVVAGASEALDADERAAPNVSLVHVMLPDRAGGVALVRALSLRGRPVVATSVSAAVREDALAAGAVRFVEKSPDAHRLLTALRHSAERRIDE